MSVDCQEIAVQLTRAVDAIRSTDTSISFKMRNLFYLRTVGTPEASAAIQQCLSGDSVLLDHEVAYVLGQMKQKNSVEFLFTLANDITVNEIVRHEAIEALGNYEDLDIAKRLGAFLNDPCPIVSESAVLALKKLSEDSSHADKVSRFGSRDPAFPFEGQFAEAVELLKAGTIEEKYKAIFYFRNLNNKAAVDALGAGFADSSDLLRHEIAYVFGQMQNEHSVDILVDVLQNPKEVDIVRHEAAEAIGNIGTEKCTQVLTALVDSDIKILRESALVGLGITSFADRHDAYLDIDN